MSPNTTLLGYYARTDVAGTPNHATSYRARFDFAGDRYGVGAEHLLVGRHFAPEVGYSRRDDFRRDLATVRFSPRFKGRRYVRRLNLQSTVDYVTAADGETVQNRAFESSAGVELHSGDQASVQYSHEYEFLPRSFRIAPGVTVPVGGYRNRTAGVSASLANQHLVAGRLTLSVGDLYGGTRREAAYSGRIAPAPQFAIEPSLSLAWVALPFGTFSARLLTSRFSYTPTTRVFVSSLVQFNVDAHTMASSLRVRWEYQPGSDLFVVFSDGRNTVRPGYDVANRSVAVKATRLMRF